MQDAGNHRGEGEALESLGALFLSFGDPRKALDFFERARPLVHQANDIHVEARADGGIAAAEIDLGRSREAADELQRALALAHQAADRVEEVELDYQLARADIRLGDLAAARDLLDRAIALAETVRSHVAGPELRAHYFATVRKAHELLIDTLMRLADVAPGHGFSAAAFEAAERARSRSLLELLQESHADVRAGVDPDLLAREQSLETALSAKARAMVRAGGQSPRDLETAQRELDELAAAFRAIEADIRVKSPAYAALTQPTTVTITDVQHRLLDADTLLLEYAIGDDRSYVWAITRDGVEVQPLSGRSAVEAAVRRVYTDASTNDPTSGAAADRALRAAGDLLLGRITIQPSIRRVAVVADGPLEYLPFSALQLRTGRSVLQRCEVVMLPSVSTLAELRRARDQHRPAERIAAAFADPVFDASDPRVTATAMIPSAVPTTGETPPVRRGPDVQRAAEDVGVVHFERLPGTRQEADAIRSLLPASARLIALDFDASREALLDPALADYRIIHIATHGLINSRHPELSGLVLSLVDRDGHARDGFVPSDELYKLRLGADLVVLSACRTALGEQIRGEGLVSLTRPFMYAGVPRIVATLWQVPDRPTAVLMTHLYRGLLRDHLSPAAALRSAQLALQRTPRWSAPYYWAAFTLQGDWR
jgi:CHAT domain-containing protein